ncbi:bifunctional 4-hydroxy-2-oxoglutarate aldolase/2-dehydro-3-deoxy-phosphogluconate aldolase [Echinimonas agarilytica]|uniref:Bifunctional 4-hydroxy-2-oxoglutarate aldolase/2-dehydro-3-deoxy-phosphogluconate aldolase n=1 Tax=Echinimonas agarilytica TaxID=1215918 RepID=A0AA42B6K6_9GAMM|nr:bifunctional 4-hydroxy-2-oxoglutarate aldolase/2-dehydro-3-deoxy-phosphogluconate aldolase [Echinimonas agarilytica]MCM2678566.1 bifunctional 4-hydroxy-2-oxoglutarate aldolase/2-dehydro-3-deoxy-phosphogluconate aldolase [Echinimonas agarilytica]
MTTFSQLMGTQTLLPIIQADTVEQGLDIAKAMADSGLKVVEVVLRSDASLEALRAIKQQHPDLLVGAGTVLDTQMLQQALDAGADFIVTPAITDALLKAVKACEVPGLPGVSTPADIALARENGFHEMKLFPASLAGGIPFLKAVSSVFRDVVFCPTGGINANNRCDYLALPNVIGVGGTWVAQKEWVEAGEWHKITDACKAVL